jgi:hypothetical protein
VCELVSHIVASVCRSLTGGAVVLLRGVRAGEGSLTTEGVSVFLHTCFAFLFFLSCTQQLL